VIRSADRATITRAVEAYAARLRREHPEIRRVIWFGSWVNGIPTPGSDVDLCIVVEHAEKPPHERPIDYLPVGFPVGVDLFVYTAEEFARLAQLSPGWYAAIQRGKEILHGSAIVTRELI
jgi:predicted nucleotidyltransferase